MSILFAVIIVSIILLIRTYQIAYTNTLICGFYEADKTFCDEAEVDMFCFYIDNESDLLGNRGCYILARKNGKYILNEPTTAKITSNWSNIFNIHEQKLQIKFENIENEEMFPSRQNITFYPAYGKIIMHSDDVINAVLYKNLLNTEYSAHSKYN